MKNNKSSNFITAVTGFYDVNRSSVDGRSAAQYVSWLNKTLEISLPFLVFLDPSFNASTIVLKPEDRIIRVSKNDLTMFKHRKEIEHILATSDTVNRRDIAFNLADYGMIVMSKPELVKRAAKETDSDFLVWIDAGLSRLLPDFSKSTVSIAASELDGMTIGINTTFHLAQRIRLGRFPRRMIGTCLAMMSAGDFIVARSFAEEFSNRLDFMVQKEWLPNGLWDNEQVAIGSLLFRGGLPGARTLFTGVGSEANTSRWIFGAPLRHNRLPLYVRWRLFLDEIRTKLTPDKDCYLPDDFPETEFRKFVDGRKN